MNKTRNRKKNTADENFIGYLYLVIAIVLCLIALMHEMTGFLGRWLYLLSRFLFGVLWFIPYVLITIYCIMRAFRFRLPNKVWTSIGLFFLAGLMICGCVSFRKSEGGLNLIKEFFARSKEIISGGEMGKGGLSGVITYGLISAAADFWGVIIVICVLFAVGVLIHLPEIRKLLNRPKKPETVKKKPAEEKARQFTLFDEIKASQQEKKKEKQLKLELENERKQLETKLERREEKKEAEVPAVVPASSTPTPLKNFKLPSLSYLETPSVNKGSINRRNAAEKWELLRDILESFDLDSRLEGYNIGPSITQFEIVPEGSFNINKYATIEGNMKMAMAVPSLRIEAPIPGKRAVGIEIPNEEPTLVRLKELLKDVPDKYQYEPLMFVLGKDITGKGVYSLINKMPHILVAGATGSGKSVCINSIILTILLRARPDEVKLLLVDPKKVEFSAYANIPHLICPIITESDKVPSALVKLEQIMNERYELFSNSGARNIDEFNEKYPERKIYRIVCIIDELADIMNHHGKELEISVSRLASLSRAAGIHMILATQRPSTDVITGTIKANIVSRIAFAVISGYDSKTIIDAPGAEKLLGNGDMLFKPGDAGRPTRIQGVFVSKQEIDTVTEYFTKSGYYPEYDDRFLHDEQEEGESGESVPSGVKDRQYPEVEKWVMTQETVSANQIQRRFNMGYPHAANLIDALEYNGVISGPRGSKPRDVLKRSE